LRNQRDLRFRHVLGGLLAWLGEQPDFDSVAIDRCMAPPVAMFRVTLSVIWNSQVLNASALIEAREAPSRRDRAYRFVAKRLDAARADLTAQIRAIEWGTPRHG
jgi:hypothetical protein